MIAKKQPDIRIDPKKDRLSRCYPRSLSGSYHQNMYTSVYLFLFLLIARVNLADSAGEAIPNATKWIVGSECSKAKSGCK
jgi:hypothetical protein